MNDRQLKNLKIYSVYLDDEKILMSDYNVNMGKLLELLRDIWWNSDWGIVQKGNELQLHTGGWSENEDIMNILKYSLFWALSWEKTERGGHYYFNLNKFPKYKDEMLQLEHVNNATSNETKEKCERAKQEVCTNFQSELVIDECSEICKRAYNWFNFGYKIAKSMYKQDKEIT